MNERHSQVKTADTIVSDCLYLQGAWCGTDQLSSKYEQWNYDTETTVINTGI